MKQSKIKKKRVKLLFCYLSQIFQMKKREIERDKNQNVQIETPPTIHSMELFSSTHFRSREQTILSIY